jgi:gamma-glutamylcyclotransferase (GGCT)/AIG2-like uncharacterized protein YtfP
VGGIGGPAELPFFVYGTLRPRERNHRVFLRGRLAGQEPAVLPGAVLYAGPGYPFAVETERAGADRVVGDLLTAAPGEYTALLAVLDELEGYAAPGDPHNLYERVFLDVRRAAGATVTAWVYVAPPATAAELRSSGRLVRGGDWSDRGRPGRGSRQP